MRVLLYALGAVGLAATVSPDALRSVLATAASALLEATPFLLAGVLAARFLRRNAAVAYLGCGCGGGPSARSLPAAAATWLTFGPLIAVVRFAAAVGIAWILCRRSHRCDTRESPRLLDELAAVLPAALLAGIVMQLSTLLDLQKAPAFVQAVAGALLGFGAAPCGLGAVALAGSLHARAPFAAAAFLCIAGVADLRAFAGRHAHRTPGHDALAYLLLVAALGIVAWRHGDSLVHPIVAFALGLCAVAAAAYAVRYRSQQCRRLRIAPTLMLLGALVTAPAPQYHATETTLTELFPGERLTFTGVLTRDAHGAALVRYAITCCRADAAPVAIRLERAPAFPPNTWLRADGIIESNPDGLALLAHRVERLAPPSDPFIYR